MKRRYPFCPFVSRTRHAHPHREQFQQAPQIDRQHRNREHIVDLGPAAHLDLTDCRFLIFVDHHRLN